MYDNHQSHFKSLFTNILALKIGNIPMPEKLKVKVTDDEQEVTFKMEMVWNGQRSGARQTFPRFEVPPFVPLPEHEQDGGLLFTLQMLDNPNLLEEHRAYWEFINITAEHFAYKTTQFFRANWEYAITIVHVPPFPDNFLFDVVEMSDKFIPKDIENLVSFYYFKSHESAFEASLKIRHELERWQVYMREAYSAELQNGTLSPYAWTPYTRQMLVDHLSYYVEHVLKGKVGKA